MGTTVKNLSRILDLYYKGILNQKFSMIELGAQELYCEGQEEFLLSFIDHFSKKNPGIKKRQHYSDEQINQLSHNGLVGDLIIACGQKYKALDIFKTEHAILFDLNFHSPGEELTGQFDLVTNFGTTEHIINQHHAMKTIHELAKTGGLIYHALPLAGYHMHGYFSYNPLFFQQIASANNYNIILQNYSKSITADPTPGFMIEGGYPDKSFHNYGIEFILQKTSSEPFKMPLETSTSLDIDYTLWNKDNPYIEKDNLKKNNTPSNDNEITPIQIIRFPWLVQVSGWDLQKELLRRYKEKMLKLLRFK